MLNFSFIPNTASEKRIFEYFFFSKIYPLCCYSNKTNKVIFTKVALNVKDYSINIYVKTKFKYPQPDNRFSGEIFTLLQLKTFNLLHGQVFLVLVTYKSYINQTGFLISIARVASLNYRQ